LGEDKISRWVLEVEGVETVQGSGMGCERHLISRLHVKYKQTPSSCISLEHNPKFGKHSLIVIHRLVFFVVWDQFMQHLKNKNALSAGPDFLGEVGILHGHHT
jgi:hypothetical protein